MPSGYRSIYTGPEIDRLLTKIPKDSTILTQEEVDKIPDETITEMFEEIFGEEEQEIEP